MPSADFCAAVGSPRGSPSSELGTQRRPPQVSSIAFPTPLSDLQPWSLMDMDFVISRPLVRPEMPLIRDLTNRKRIRGISGRTSGRLITKSISIKDQGCRSDRGVGKAIELTWGGLRCVPSSELGEPRGDPTAAQKSADGIVGQAVGKASEALQGS